jgi:hypothetical protein
MYARRFPITRSIYTMLTYPPEPEKNGFNTPTWRSVPLPPPCFTLTNSSQRTSYLIYVYRPPRWALSSDTGGGERRYEKAKYAFDVRFLLNPAFGSYFFSDTITILHLLANGPTAYFKSTSVELTRQIFVRPLRMQLYGVQGCNWLQQGHACATPHHPQLILNGIVTRLGHAVGRMFQTTFPPLPEFQGRQVATLHHQRDLIFFRRHRLVHPLLPNFDDSDRFE